MPCAIGLAVLAEPVTALLGRYSGDRLVLAASLMRVLAITIIFDAVVLVTTAIMQSHGHAGRPVINMLVGGVLKLLAVYILTGNPHIGILGTPIGTLICYFMISVLNLVSIRQLIPQTPAIVRNLVRSLLAALVMGIFVWGAWFGMKHLGISSRLLLCAAPIAAGVVVYFVAAVAMKAITREDCLLLPKGDKIAKVLHL